MSINYITGNAAKPIGDGTKIIAHICNDAGGWGKGFVLDVSQHYPMAEAMYRRWATHAREDGVSFALGKVQFVNTSLEPSLFAHNKPPIYVANMIAQHGYRQHYDDPPLQYVDYGALGSCLETVAIFAKSHNASVHMPRIGCGLGGGKWEDVEPVIRGTLVAMEVPVTVYDQP